jgi:hypothetical protein
MKLWTKKLCNKYFELTCNRCNRSGSRANKGAIGYIGLAYKLKEVKQLAISYQGKTLLSHL